MQIRKKMFLAVKKIIGEAAARNNRKRVESKEPMWN